MNLYEKKFLFTSEKENKLNRKLKVILRCVRISTYNPDKEL